MRKKAYWAAYRQIAQPAIFDLQPNDTEVVAADWVSLAEARRRFVATNGEDKQAILLRALDVCEQIVSGTSLHLPNFDES